MLISKRPIGTVSYLGGLISTPDPFTWSWGQMIQFNSEYLARPGEYVHCERSTTTDRAYARNELSLKFLGDWLFMTDCDHAFEPDVVLRMVTLFEENDLDVLTGVYVSKAPPYPPMLHWYDESAKMFRIISKWSPDAKLAEISRVGAGCLLIRRRVFAAISKDLGERPFDCIHPWSEDFSFFDRLRRIGIKAHAALHVESRHLVLRGLTTEDFRADEMEMYTPDVPVPTYGDSKAFHSTGA